MTEGNPWVPYHEASEAKAKELAAGKKTETAKFKTITEWVSRCFAYDYIKAVRVAKKKGVLPDVEHTWKWHMGICQDIAAMTTGMLRAVGIRAILCIGKVDGHRTNHAWVEAMVDGERLRYDYSKAGTNYEIERRY